MKKQLILASGSPRRKELLQQVNLSFEVIKSNVDENIDPHLPPSELVQSLSFQKASSVAKDYKNAFVIGADTIVSLNEKILGKPENKEDAYSILKQLSGREHDVLTGVTIINGKENISFYDKTLVEFWHLTDEEIWEYIETGEPMDKAGAYGIQGLGAYFVKRINGDYFSVVGLPISRLVRELYNLGFK